jgi:hypothetical protein
MLRFENAFSNNRYGYSQARSADPGLQWSASVMKELVCSVTMSGKKAHDHLNDFFYAIFNGPQSCKILFYYH